MRTITRLRHLSYANVMATIAVFMALGGGAYAATQLPANAVKARNIAAGAVSSSKVKNHSLLARDFKPGQLQRGAAGPQGAQGPQGPQGPQGDPGTDGKDGRDGALGYNVVFQDFTFPAGASRKSFALRCSSGDVPLGGGGSMPFGLHILTSMPLQNLNWELDVATDDGKPAAASSTVRIEMTCGRSS